MDMDRDAPHDEPTPVQARRYATPQVTYHGHPPPQGAVALQPPAPPPVPYAAPTHSHPLAALPSPSPTELKAASFVKTVYNHFHDDEATKLAFNTICKRFGDGKLTAGDFYVELHRFFRQNDARCLIPRLKAFVPRAWTKADVAWLDAAIEKEDVAGRREHGSLVVTLPVVRSRRVVKLGVKRRREVGE